MGVGLVLIFQVVTMNGNSAYSCRTGRCSRSFKFKRFFHTNIIADLV